MIPYYSPIISTLKPESLCFSLQGTAIFPNCDTGDCGTAVGDVTVCCLFPAGCEPGFDDDDIRTTFFIPNRTDTSDPPCVISASDPDSGLSNFTVGACGFLLLNPSCGNGQIWQITCAFGDTNVPGPVAEDVCGHSCGNNPSNFTVTVNCDGNISGDCDNTVAFPSC